MTYQNKKIAVIGLAVSNTPLIKYLVAAGAKVAVFDKKPASALEQFLSQLKGMDLRFFLGADYLTHLHGFDYLFVTPGMKKDLPELKTARAEGAVSGSEMELFLKMAPGTVIGITGSSGKTTTTTLVGKMAGAFFPETYVGGNIGRSLLAELPQMTAQARIILELSSFQLQELRQSPHIAVITNITPNHLDMHASMEEYIAAKSNVLNYQTPTDIAILNYDNEITYNLRKLVKGRAYFFSRRLIPETGAYLDGAELLIKLDGKKERITSKPNLKLLGDHNVENVLAAALTARLAGVEPSVITQTVESFTGVEHRLELVRELNGVKYYNDSISTTPDRAIAGLKAMTGPVLLIAGGYDKQLPFTNLAAEIVKICQRLIVLGATAPLIIEAVRTVDGRFPIRQVKNLEEAVAAAASLAVAGDAVLLSPACASYDMFNNYQERGALFKRLIGEL